MTTSTTIYNTVTIDTGPPGPHSGFKILKIANVDGGSGNYQVTWRPICDLTEEERQQISCAINYQDDQLEDGDCDVSPPCTYFSDEATCCRSGDCGIDDTVYTRYRTGQTDRELIVSIDNIPQFAQQSGDPCQLIFHWQLLDLDTGDTFDGCCGVIFEWRVITPAPLIVSISSDSPQITIDTSDLAPSASFTAEIIDINGGVGPYAITWSYEGNTGDCYGTSTVEISAGIFDAGIITLTVDSVPINTISDPSNPCIAHLAWSVVDQGVLNDLGEYAGRTETGTIEVSLRAVPSTLPTLSIFSDGCGSTVPVDTGPGLGSSSLDLSITDITGGSGSYAVTWDENPTGMSGSTHGYIIATVHPTIETILQITIADAPQFASGSAGRTYRARIVDTGTGNIEYYDCTFTVIYAPSALTSPIPTVTIEQTGSLTAMNAGSCSMYRTQTSSAIVSQITGGSGSYEITWDVTSPIIAGLTSSTATTNSSYTDGVLTITAAADVNLVAGATYNVTCTVSDTITGAVSETTFDKAFNITASIMCDSLVISIDGNNQIVHKSNHVGATLTTDPAVLTATALGGTGNYAISWNPLPVSTTGTCYTRNVTQTQIGTDSRELSIFLSDFLETDDNTSTPCFSEFQVTVTDLGNGLSASATAGVYFEIEQYTDDCSLTLTSYTGGVAGVNLAGAVQTRSIDLIGLGGGYTDYEISYRILNQAGGVAAFDSWPGDLLVVETPSTSLSTIVEFTPPGGFAGFSEITVLVFVKSWDLTHTTYRSLCTPIEITYNVTWDGSADPTGTLTCPAGVPALTREVPYVTRTYSVSSPVGVKGYTWGVSGCLALSVVGSGTHGAVYTVTYTADSDGPGIGGVCAPVITCLLEGPGGSTALQCYESISYYTIPDTITLSSITNCGQSKTIATNAISRAATFNGMQAQHTSGAGAPHTYAWTLVGTSGSCAGVVWSPTSSSDRTLTVTASVPDSTLSGTCTATWACQVADAQSTLSEVLTCTTTVTYVAASLQMLVTDSDGDPFTTLASVAWVGYPGNGWTDCDAGAYAACSGPYANGVVPGVEGPLYTVVPGKAMRVTPSGGVAPYVITIEDVAGSFGTLPDCLRFHIDGAASLAGVDSGTVSGNNVVVSRTVGEGVPTDFSVTSTCGIVPYNVAGSFRVVVTDATTATVSATYTFSSKRLVSDRLN
jgi:hypothetical protein